MLYDQLIRSQVGGGQNTLLTNYHKFHTLRKAILHADWIKYKQGTYKLGKGDQKIGRRREEMCRRFNGPKGCWFSEEDCYYKHQCLSCGKGCHGKPQCQTEAN